MGNMWINQTGDVLFRTPTWRTHFCVLRPHSCGRVFSPAMRPKSRHECVRHAGVRRASQAAGATSARIRSLIRL